MRNPLSVNYIVVIVLLMAGCGTGTVSDERIDSIARVFWHEYDRYSVLVEKGDGVYITLNFPRNKCNTNRPALIIADVPSDKKMWVSAKIRRGSQTNADPCFEELDFHIHSLNDVSGGSWNHGKFGTGQTSVIK